MKELVTVLVVALTVIAYCSVEAQYNDRIKLVNVVFRHGDRAPDSNGLESYPNDPDLNNTFWPMGLGGLTNAGKLREYQLGQFLRQRYGNLLNEIYVPEEVSARSTDVDRTKMSLQLVLSGLYPPKGQQKWNPNLDWQPIPAYSVPTLDDNLMIPEECPKYLKARERVENSLEFQQKLGKFRDLMKALTNETGKEITNSNDLYFLYHGLMAKKSIGEKLPEWAENIFPNGDLLDGINLEYEIFSYNDEMRRLNGGMLLSKIIDNMKERARNPESKRKIHLYSGHETNVAALLQALGIYEPHAPEYSSAVIIELEQILFKYFVRVRYYKGIDKDRSGIVETKVVPGCESGNLCHFEDFQRALENVIPTAEDTQCDKRSLRSSLRNNEIKVAGGIITQIIQKIEEDDQMRNVLH